MKKTIQKTLALVLAILLMFGTATVGFAASVGQVTKLALASHTSTQIKIKWKSVAKADGYLVELYDGDEEEWTVENYTTNAYYVDKALTPGTKYAYRVKAYVKSGGGRTFGKASDKLSVLTDPERVMKVKATVLSPTAVKLEWPAAAGACSYQVFRSSTADGKYKKVTETDKTSCKVSFSSAPGTVYFKVKSVAEDGTLTRAAAASPAADVKVLPNAVQEVTVNDYTASTVTLKWDAAKGAAGYYILKKDVTTNKEYVQLAKTTDTTYKVNFPAAPGTVYFKVQAFSKFGGAVNTAKASAPVKLNLKPDKVTGLVAMNATSSSITLAWSAADGATSYEICQRDESFDYVPIATVSETTYTVTGLSKNSEYYFYVTAIADYNGNILRGPKSDVLNNAQTVFGNIENFKISVESDGKVWASWSPVKGAEGYVIEKSTDGTTWAQVADTKDCSFEVTSVEPNGVLPKGGAVSYRVYAYTTENGARITTDPTEPKAVRALTDVPKITRAGTASQHSVCLEWTTVEGADGYMVERYDTISGQWLTSTMNKMRSYVNEKGENITYCSIPENASGTFQYRVCSFVSNGGVKTQSEFSEPFEWNYVYAEPPAKQYPDAIQKSGIVGYLYDQEAGVFYTADDPWQRVFGFNTVYDMASPFIMLPYDTDRIKFTCHGGEKWMIQPWKGQYGMILYGSEVGVYRQYTDRNVEHYDCVQDDEKLMMDMQFYRREENSSVWPENPEFTRPYAEYWWVTGFTFGFVRMKNPIEALKNVNFTDFKITFRITMLDFDMRNAFKQALLDEIEYEKSHYGFKNDKGESVGRFTILKEDGLDFWIAYV